MSTHDTSAERTNGGLGVPGIRPRGAEGPDVTFTDDSDTPVFWCEVSTSSGRYSHFETRRATGRDRSTATVRSSCSCPDSVDAATAKGWVDRFCATRRSRHLHTYIGVTVRFVNRADDGLGSHPLGQRLPQHMPEEVGDE